MPTRFLPVKLTDSDRLIISRDQNEALEAEDAAREAKKTAGAQHTAEIKKHGSKARELRAALRRGTIDREIEIEERTDVARRIVEVFRLDTKELVDSRRLDDDERQLEMNKLDEHIKKSVTAGQRNVDPPTEEQVLAESPEEAEQLREQRLATEKKERDRQEAAEVWLNALQPKIMVFTAEEDIDGFVAKVGGVHGFPWTILSADGQTEEEARKNLGDQLIAQFIGAVEKKERDRQEKILNQLGELLAKVQITKADGGGVVATVDLGASTSEATGEDEAAATKALRAKLIEILESRETEIEQLAAAQAQDEARDGIKRPRALLKPPAGAKKGKKAKGEAKTDPPAPPKTDDDKPEGLAF